MEYMQLMYTYAPAWGFGGPTRIMYDYARWMVDATSRTTVIAGDINHDYSPIERKSEVMQGIRIRRIPVYWRHLVKRGFNCVSPSMLLIAAWGVMRSPSRVVIHLGELRSPVFLYAVIIKRIFPRKVVLIHSAFGMLHFKSSKIRRIYDSMFMGLMLRSIDVALAQNEHEVSCYQEYFLRYKVVGGSITLFPLHVVKHELISAPSVDGKEKKRAALRKKYAVPEDAFVLIFFGRLHPAKGIIRAIDVFLQFSKEHNGPTYLLIVGRDDGFQHQVMDYIRECGATSSIRIVNDVYDDRFEYYTLADTFVGFPTIYEETMLASVEALSCGTPVIVSREADIPFVEEESAGFVIDFTVDVATDRIHQIAAHPGMFRSQALKVAEQHFSETTARNNLIAILSQSIDRLGRFDQ